MAVKLCTCSEYLLTLLFVSVMSRWVFFSGPRFESCVVLSHFMEEMHSIFKDRSPHKVHKSLSESYGMRQEGGERS